MHAYIYVCNNSLLYLKAKYISIIKPSGLNKFSKKKKKKKKKKLELSFAFAFTWIPKM